MSEELERVRKHILDEIMEEIHIDRMLDRMRREPDCIVVVTNGKRYVITVEEELQLTSRNQAAEAMGVLERLVIAADAKIDEAEGWYVVSGRCGEFCGEGNSLIEAVLKAGGEG